MGGAESEAMRAPSADMLLMFGKALDEAMRSAGLAPAAVGAHVGVSDDAVRKWIRGDAEPPPWRVFGVEQLLELPPGDLSRHLGFVPVGTRSVLAAIDADQALTERDRKVLRTTYRALRS